MLISDQQDRPVDTARLRRLAAFVLDDQGVPADVGLSVVVADAASMAGLNLTHMGEDGPTDVLAFPMDDAWEPGAELLGDVVVAPEVAAAQTRTTVDDELDLLLVHGILHLLGHDHVDQAERDEMFGLTHRLLEGYRAVTP